MKIKLLLFLLLVTPLVLLLLYTGQKIHGMAQLRGWLPGAEFHQHTITSKYTSASRHGHTVYWLSWSPQKGKPQGLFTASDLRVDVSKKIYDESAVGSTLEVLTYHGFSTPYPVGGGIYASDGNFAFDFLLLVGECWAVFWVARTSFFPRQRDRDAEAAALLRAKNTLR